MRILFLAFDGVLHPASAAVRFAPVGPLKEAVQQAWLFRWAWVVDELLEAAPEVGIVTHSNWRRLVSDDALRSLLGPLGRRFIGSTPPLDRWPSIAELVQQNHLDDYRIVDAWPEAFPAQLDELILCDPERGVRDDNVCEQLSQWLSRRPRSLLR